MTASTTLISDLGLLCALRGHKPDAAIARWNRGHCFSRCRRCGRDLVRTAYGGWEVPKGYRIVWHPAPAQATGEPAPAAEAPRAEPAEAAALDAPGFEPEPADAAAEEMTFTDRIPVAEAVEAAEADEVAPEPAEPILKPAETPAEPVTAEAPPGPEWPISAAAAEPAEQDEQQFDALPVPADAPAAEPRSEQAETCLDEPPAGQPEPPAIPDFMNENEDEPDWGDVAPAPARAAHG